MNAVFYAIVLLAFAGALAFQTPAEVGAAALASAKTAVELAIGLVGYMALFLGLMKVVEEAGGLAWMARAKDPARPRLWSTVASRMPSKLT